MANQDASKTKNIFIIAGEASGDEHAAKLINELKSLGPDTFSFSGIGGELMSKAGADILYPLAQYGVTGFTEVIKQFKHIQTAYTLAKNYIEKNKIDLIILVDYPGFNLRFAKFAKQKNIKILYYISPQIWAWKEKRIHTIKKCIDTMAVILPFEKEIYKKHNTKAYFVGNPLTETTRTFLTNQEVKTKYNLSQKKKIIGILPGSRVNEIKQILPTMLKSAKILDSKHPKQLQFVLPLASSLKLSNIEPYLKHINIDIKIVSKENCNIDIMSCCSALMVASGTASLQAALLHKPMIIVYKTSRLTYLIASQVMKCKYIGLINLLAGKMIIPELIQNDFNSSNLAKELNRFITDQKYNLKIEQQLKKISKMLENKSVDCKLAHLVFDLVEQERAPTKEASKSK